MALIEVEHLKKYFNVATGINHAVDDVSFKIEKGHTMGIVGESGCGKSTLGRTIIRLAQATEGHVYLDGEEITYAKGRELKKLRERMSIVFQDPYSSLNPRRCVEDTIREPMLESHKFTRAEVADRTETLMDLVGIEERLRNAYPHEMDGGRRQRVGIARAIALNPEFIMCDEPVSALDVSIQAQILNLLMDLQEKLGMTYMFVTHDLSVVRHIADDISVMYLGQMVETGPTKVIFEETAHPYTKALLSAIPSTDILHPMQRVKLQGEITSAINPKPGCRFAQRCPYANEGCHEPQELREVADGHFVACHRVGEI